MRVRGLYTLAGIGLLSLAAVARAQDRGKAPPPPAVVTITVREQELHHSSEFIGHVQVIQSVDVRAQVTGTLAWVAFEGG